MNAHSQTLTLPGSLPLDGGGELTRVELAFETYGDLNADRSNAILLCHALTGDQYVASPHPITGKPGWWWRLVGWRLAARGVPAVCSCRRLSC